MLRRREEPQPRSMKTATGGSKKAKIILQQSAQLTTIVLVAHLGRGGVVIHRIRTRTSSRLILNIDGHDKSGEAGPRYYTICYYHYENLRTTQYA